MFDKMQENWRNKKIQQHLQDNKDVYIALGFGLMIGWIMKDLYGSFRIVNTNTVSPTISPTISPSIHIVTVADGRGHPGFGVRRVDTGQEWPKQILAAIEEGIDPVALSKHINGRTPHINEVVYERIPKIVA